jgi:hypothetical protein
VAQHLVASRIVLNSIELVSSLVSYCSGSGTGPLSIVSTIEDLPERKISGSGLEIRDYGHRDQSH